MFKKFLEYFNEKEISIISDDPFDTFLKMFSGRQFGNGILTIFQEKDINIWQKNISDAFPIAKGRFSLFGYDWLGNCFGIAVDETNMGKVILFEIGTGEILSTGCDFEDFLDNEIPYNNKACLASQFYQKWLENGGIPVKYGRCIGYKIPLFMGGHDDIANLEESDMDVYWSIVSQVMTKMGINR